MNKIIKQRSSTHGDFEYGARIFSSLHQNVIDASEAGRLTDRQYYALTHIMGKITRILVGDASFEDHWMDLSNYALLGGALERK